IDSESGEVRQAFLQEDDVRRTPYYRDGVDAITLEGILTDKQLRDIAASSRDGTLEFRIDYLVCSKTSSRAEKATFSREEIVTAIGDILEQRGGADDSPGTNAPLTKREVLEVKSRLASTKSIRVTGDDTELISLVIEIPSGTRPLFEERIISLADLRDHHRSFRDSVLADAQGILQESIAEVAAHEDLSEYGMNQDQLRNLCKWQESNSSASAGGCGFFLGGFGGGVATAQSDSKSKAGLREKIVGKMQEKARAKGFETRHVESESWLAFETIEAAQLSSAAVDSTKASYVLIEHQGAATLAVYRDSVPYEVAIKPELRHDQFQQMVRDQVDRLLAPHAEEIASDEILQKVKGQLELTLEEICDKRKSQTPEQHNLYAAYYQGLRSQISTLTPIKGLKDCTDIDVETKMCLVIAYSRAFRWAM
ncbi:hypothetical protein MRY87_11815, partial [bacterium]|nr:hypothetical protein [bacterium]